MKKYLFLLTVLLLVSCQNLAPQPHKQKQLTQADPAAVDTAQAAVSISHSLSELGLVQRNEQGMLKRESEQSDLPQVLSRLVSIDWAGPVEPLIKQLAEGTQLRVKVLGSEPAIPVMVSLRKRDTSVYLILQDLRGQIGNRAEIMVYPSSGVIELHYL
jgi:defect in organelle trafficking protein DotD